MSSKRISVCCSQMRSNRSPFQTGRHDSLALRRATRSPSSKTCACWETASRRSNLRVELTESVLTNYHNLSARRASLSAHIYTTEAVLLFLSFLEHPEHLLLLQYLIPTAPQNALLSFPPSRSTPHASFFSYSSNLGRICDRRRGPSHVAHQTRQWRDEAGETRPGWMRVLAMEIMWGCVFLYQ